MSKDPKTLIIAALNDSLRKSGVHGQVVITKSVAALEHEKLTSLVEKVRSFNDFNEHNDPYGEHDFGAVTLDGELYYWKIDYYANDMMHGSEDPSDVKKTKRVMTIMHRFEY